MTNPFHNNKTLPSLICELELGIQDLPFPLRTVINAVGCVSFQSLPGEIKVCQWFFFSF